MEASVMVFLIWCLCFALFIFFTASSAEWAFTKASQDGFDDTIFCLNFLRCCLKFIIYFLLIVLDLLFSNYAFDIDDIE